MNNVSEETIEQTKVQATKEVRDVLEMLEKDYPGVTEGLATALGAGVGAAGSLAALTTLGVSGLSAAGITSGLATAGSILGGGMVAGIGVLAAPVALLGVAGYALTKKYKSAKLAAALATAIEKLYAIQVRLMENAEYYKAEISGIKMTIEMLLQKKQAKK